MSIKTLLIIAHTPSKNTKLLADTVLAGALEQAQQEDIAFNIILQSPTETNASDVLKADALILGTVENLAYMSGLTKDFFDRCYYDLLDNKQGMPYVVYIRAGHDGTATKNALVTINNGLSWQVIAEPLVLQGDWSGSFVDEVKELSMAMVAGLALGIF